MEIEEICSFLKGVPILNGLDEKNLASLAKNTHLLSFSDNEIICDEDEKGDSLFIIVEGNVEIAKKKREKEMLHLATLKERNIFGEISMLSGFPRSAAAIARGNVKLLELTASDFRSLVIIDNWTAFKFLYEIARLLCGRLRRLDEQHTEHMTLCTAGKDKEMKDFLAFKERLLKDWSF